MPSAIHLGLRRPGIRGGSGVAGARLGDDGLRWASLAGAALARLALRGSMSMVMVVVPGVAGWGRVSSGGHRDSPVGTMLAWADPVPVTASMPIMESKIVGSVAWVRTSTTPSVTVTEPVTPGWPAR